MAETEEFNREWARIFNMKKKAKGADCGLKGQQDGI